MRLVKAYDPIRATTEWRPDVSLEEQARRGIKSIQLRISNPDLREDCRQLAKNELARWRRILIQLKNSK